MHTEPGTSCLSPRAGSVVTFGAGQVRGETSRLASLRAAASLLVVVGWLLQNRGFCGGLASEDQEAAGGIQHSAWDSTSEKNIPHFSLSFLICNT